MNTTTISEYSIIPMEYDVMIGLDVDKHSISATMVDHYGFQKSITVPYDSTALLNYTRKHFDKKRIAFAYEAGPTGYGLYDALQTAGHPCLVVASSMVPMRRGSQVKTNRLDSKQLAESMRGGQLKGIRVPLTVYRELRHLTQLRSMYVRHVSGTKCRIKALLLMEGLSFPDAPPNSQWSARVIEALAHLSVSATVRFKLDCLLETLAFHQRQALITQRQIRRVCSENQELADSIRYLTSLPGIGWIVASTALARIGDWRQLRTVHELGAFFGLVPSEHSTGDRSSKGSITQAGDPRLRSMLIEAAWSAIRQDKELSEFYHRIYQRHPRDRAARKAIVAVARKLTERMYCVLKERREYIINPIENPK
jgi:transposase